MRFIHESHYLCSESHLFLSQWQWDSKTKQPIKFQGFFYTNQSHCREMNDKKSHCLANLAIKLCDFKMDLIKFQLNFGSCNFGLKSYLWIQIQLALRVRSILKSRVWFQTKLHSTQFNYHYELIDALQLQIHGQSIATRPESQLIFLTLARPFACDTCFWIF